jgi:hypothetical protein
MGYLDYDSERTFGFFNSIRKFIAPIILGLTTSIGAGIYSHSNETARDCQLPLGFS